MRSYFFHSGGANVRLLADKLRIAHGTAPPARNEEYTIIQWDVTNETLPDEYVLNPATMKMRLLNHKKRNELLRLGGQLVEDNADLNPVSVSGNITPHAVVRYSREWIVPVFHLRALAAFEKKAEPFIAGNTSSHLKGKYYEIDLSVRNYHLNRALREAVRAIYALGLDFGIVFLGANADGKLVIRNVQATPRLNDRLADLYAESIHQFDEQLQSDSQRHATSVMLGADPEFVLRGEDGNIVLASRYLEKQGEVGCDSIVLPDFQRLYSLVELRPEPTAMPEHLVRNIWRTMRKAGKLITDQRLEWLAGGMPIEGFPLGGHIHFSGVRLSSRLLRVLDNYLTLPLALLEDSSAVMRRPQYGYLGDFRRKSHGGFEYRTPPSWLVSPLIAAGVLSLARLLAVHYDELRQNPLRSEKIQTYYYKGNKQKLLPAVKKIWKEIETLPSYEMHKTFLDRFKEKVFLMEGWKEKSDIRSRWKLHK